MNKYQEAYNVLYDRMTISEDFEIIVAMKTIQELVEKATPKKTIQLENKDRSRCPNCKSQLPFRKNALKKQNPRVCCDRCGQAIDWSEEE